LLLYLAVFWQTVFFIEVESCKAKTSFEGSYLPIIAPFPTYGKNFVL
jgi:hypothetical protein